MSISRIITDDESITWGQAMFIIGLFLAIIIGAGILLVVFQPVFEGLFV